MQKLFAFCYMEPSRRPVLWTGWFPEVSTSPFKAHVFHMLILPLDIAKVHLLLPKGGKIPCWKLSGDSPEATNQIWLRLQREKRKGHHELSDSDCCWICWLLGQHLFDLLQPQWNQYEFVSTWSSGWLAITITQTTTNNEHMFVHRANM